MHTHTQTFTAPQSLFLAAVQHYGEKIIWMVTSATCIWPPTSSWGPCFRETFFPPSSSTKPSYREFPSCEWTSRRQGSAKSDWWLGSVCLLLLFIHVFILPVVIPSDPAFLHPLLPLPWGANEETLSSYIRCDTYPPQPLFLCPSVSDREKLSNFFVLALQQYS